MGQTAGRLASVGTSIFASMTALAHRYNAINLAQGFPDFDGPQRAKRAAIAAIEGGANQYAPMPGVPELRRKVAEDFAARTGLAIDPDAHVTVTSGCTEAIAATLLGLINPGDAVVTFEPFYDAYRAGVMMAGGVLRTVELRPPPATSPPDAAFLFDPEQLKRTFEKPPRAIILNTPHNPTGKVFTRAELELIASLCHQAGTIAITDEVYEHLIYDTSPHVPLASLPGMFERTVTLSSLGKTHSLTGWKVGWAIAPTELTAGVRAAHQFLTFATATPMQHGAAAVIGAGGDDLAQLRGLYIRNRDALCEGLSSVGLRVFRPASGYFVMADHSALGLGDDLEFCRLLVERVGVAAIPPSAFYQDSKAGSLLARFAFCKQASTIDRALERVRGLPGLKR